MTFTKRSVIVEEVPAWEECNLCTEVYREFCSKCMGEGGRWHEAVVYFAPGATIQNVNLYSMNPYIGKGVEVTKSTILQREWEVCEWCGGGKEMESPGRHGGYHYEVAPCSRCWNGEESTGCEPDTAGKWRIK